MQKRIKKILAKQIVKKLNGRKITEKTFMAEDMALFPCSWFTAKKIVDYPNYLPKNQKNLAKMLDYFEVSNIIDEFGIVQLTKNMANDI